MFSSNSSVLNGLFQGTNVGRGKEKVYHLNHALWTLGEQYTNHYSLSVRRELFHLYVPLIDSSHNTSWGPERQLSSENHT